jgi:hypothetical protein
MATSYGCPRCGRWHDASASCDVGDALRAFFSSDPSLVQRRRTADAAERVAIARFYLWRAANLPGRWNRPIV